MKIEYDLNEKIYLPFRIIEIYVNSLGEVSYTVASAAPCIYFKQTGISQKNIDMYSLTFRKRGQHEENI